MTDVGTAVALYLDTFGATYGDAGVNIFANSRPSTPHAVVVCTQTVGQSPQMGLGGGGPLLVSPGLQIIVRGTPTEDYDVVYARAMAIYTLLSNKLDLTLSGERYLHFTPTDLPAMIQKDDQERLLFSMNFTVTKG